MTEATATSCPADAVAAGAVVASAGAGATIAAVLSLRRHHCHQLLFHLFACCGCRKNSGRVKETKKGGRHRKVGEGMIVFGASRVNGTETVRDRTKKEELTSVVRGGE
jgi:hypothetical protein